jgi:hypothetical protein
MSLKKLKERLKGDLKSDFMVHKINPKEKYKTIELPIDWDKQKEMATWSEKNAMEVARILKPYVGQIMVLYGGGGWDSNIVRLKNIKVEPQLHYGRIYKGVRQEFKTPKLSKTDFNVVATLKTMGDWKKEGAMFSEVKTSAKMEGKKYIPPTFKENLFEPHLGSWRLMKIIKV